MPRTFTVPAATAPRKPFNLVLSAEEYRKLNELANATGLSAAAVLRNALLAFHGMKIFGVPTCANGQTCFVPQMHAARPQMPATVPGYTTGQE
jgi:hypothetical protein